MAIFTVYNPPTSSCSVSVYRYLRNAAKASADASVTLTVFVWLSLRAAPNMVRKYSQLWTRMRVHTVGRVV